MKNNTSKDRIIKTWKSDRKILTNGHLKFIACVIMLISHIAQTGLIYAIGYPDLYYPMMVIGRIAFPIFCFFIVQGVILTSDIKKYLIRLFIFALISEIPFDLAFSGYIDFESQNVFFTLLLGGCLVFLIERIKETNFNIGIKIIISIILALGFSILSIILKTDYSYRGVIAILLIYLATYNKFLTIIAMLFAFYFEAHLHGFVYLSIPLIMLYNGQKGKQNKWAFYIFYPAHLLIIFIIKNLLF